MRPTVIFSQTKHLLNTFSRFEFSATATRIPSVPQLHRLDQETGLTQFEQMKEIVRTATDTSRLLTLVSKQNLQKKLKMEEMRMAGSGRLGLLLTCKVAPWLIPRNMPLAVMTQEMIRDALTISHSHKITITNPYKDDKTLEVAKLNHVKQMTITCIEEAQKILLDSMDRRSNIPEQQLIWQFDEEISEKNELLHQMLALMRSLGINLHGLRFKQGSLKAKLIKQIVEIAKQMGHDIKQLQVQFSINDTKQYAPFVKELEKLKPTIHLQDFDTTKYMLCAAKVVGVGKNYVQLADKAQTYLSKEMAVLMNSMRNIKTGDWVTFRPAKTCKLDTTSDDLRSDNKQMI